MNSFPHILTYFRIENDLRPAQTGCFFNQSLRRSYLPSFVYPVRNSWQNRPGDRFRGMTGPIHFVRRYRLGSCITLQSALIKSPLCPKVGIIVEHSIRGLAAMQPIFHTLNAARRLSTRLLFRLPPEFHGLSRRNSNLLSGLL